MNIPCTDCGDRFGGQESYNRHLLKREDRCKTRGERKASGLVQDIWGTWKRRGSHTAAQASLIDRRTIRRHVTGKPLRDVRTESASHHEGTNTEAQGA